VSQLGIALLFVVAGPSVMPPGKEENAERWFAANRPLGLKTSWFKTLIVLGMTVAVRRKVTVKSQDDWPHH